MMSLRSVIAVALLSGGLGVGAEARVIYDNGVGLDEVNNTRLSDLDLSNDSSVQIADDFVLTEEGVAINDVHWLGVYQATGTPPPVDIFKLEIFLDSGSGNIPATGAAEYSVEIFNVQRRDTGRILQNQILWEYDGILAATIEGLEAGVTYWASIIADTSGDTDDNWFWASEKFQNDSGLGNAAGRPLGLGSLGWNRLPDEGMAFRLTAQDKEIGEVPVPATPGLLGLALLGLLGRRALR